MRIEHVAASGKRNKGFSLIEIMIVVAIIGILSAIALPSYSKYIVKARRADAQTFLLDVAQRQQQYVMDARTYAADIAELKVVVPESVSKYYTPTTAPGAGAGAPTFTATVTPKAGTSQAVDGVMTINEKGVKTPSTLW